MITSHNIRASSQWTALMITSSRFWLCRRVDIGNVDPVKNDVHTVEQLDLGIFLHELLIRFGDAFAIVFQLVHGIRKCGESASMLLECDEDMHFVPPIKGHLRAYAGQAAIYESVCNSAGDGLPSHSSVAGDMDGIADYVSWTFLALGSFGRSKLV